jgi:hypothetical protein
MSPNGLRWLQAVALMVVVPLVVACSAWLGVRLLNDFDPTQDWVAVFMALSLGALSWLLVWARFLLSTSSKEIT